LGFRQFTGNPLAQIDGKSKCYDQPDVKWKKIGRYQTILERKAEMRGELNGKHNGASDESRY
jgi:hypothetical protein